MRKARKPSFFNKDVKNDEFRFDTKINAYILVLF